MRVTFPHMGTAHLSLATLLSELGLEPVVPPPTSQRTLALGVQHAPEFACFPFKVNIGNYLEAIAAGAEVILMVGGVGPCRLGYYAEVERVILRGLGHDVALIALEPCWPELWRAVRRLIPKVSLARLGRVLAFTLAKIAVVDEIERLAIRTRAREAVRGRTTEAWQRCQAILAPVADWAGLRVAGHRCREILAEVGTEPLRFVLKVALAGEVFMVLEPVVNFGLERILGENGVEVDRQIYLSSWLRHHLWHSALACGWHERVRALARPYLANFIGGHGLESVAQAVDAGVNRLDGMIQIAPFTCMPEIVAQSLLPGISRTLDLPVMTIVIDEHAGEAGVLTRVEAFLDLLRRRNKLKNDIKF